MTDPEPEPEVALRPVRRHEGGCGSVGDGDGDAAATGTTGRCNGLGWYGGGPYTQRNGTVAARATGEQATLDTN